MSWRAFRSWIGFPTLEDVPFCEHGYRMTIGEWPTYDWECNHPPVVPGPDDHPRVDGGDPRKRAYITLPDGSVIFSPGKNERCDVCGAPMKDWDTTPCKRTLTDSGRHKITRFVIPFPNADDQ